MSRERPRSGDDVSTTAQPLRVTRRSFLYGGIATLALVACKGDDEPTPGSTTTTETTPPGTTTPPKEPPAEWYEPPEGSGYELGPTDAFSAPGSPAFPEGEVRLTAPGAFGSDGQVFFHASDQAPQDGEQLSLAGDHEWTDSELVVVLPGQDPGGADPESEEAIVAQYHITVVPTDGDPQSVPVVVWGFGDMTAFGDLPSGGGQ